LTFLYRAPTYTSHTLISFLSFRFYPFFDHHSRSALTRASASHHTDERARLSGSEPSSRLIPLNLVRRTLTTTIQYYSITLSTRTPPPS
jgi:hypothetical protein